MASISKTESNGIKNGKSLFTTPNPFEKRFGYHRAVKKGPFIFVSGSTALKLESPSNSLHEGGSKVEFPNDARAQARLSMQRCIDAVEKLGGKVEDVVRVRMYVSAHEDCEAVGLAFKDCFSTTETESNTASSNIVTEETEEGKVTTGAGVGAAATMVVIQNGYVDPDILVEVEVDAVCSE